MSLGRSTSKVSYQLSTHKKAQSKIRFLRTLETLNRLIEY